MNPRRSFYRKIGYGVVIAVLLVPLFWLGQPATSDVEGVKGSPGGQLARLREQYGLSQAQLGAIDPTSVTIKLATLGMHGIAANILWDKAIEYQMKKDWTNLSAALEQITKVQPNFIGVWRFQAWNLSYNVSQEFDDYRDRYRWVIKGIEFLKRGIKYNERSPRLLADMGWAVSQKIGVADEKKEYRRLFRQDDDFHGSRPVDRRDNWLVGREWYLKAEDLADQPGAGEIGDAPVVFYSKAPMCLMRYAEALEGDGTFGEKAKRAWTDAGRQWAQFGTVEIPGPEGKVLRLGNFQAEIQRLNQRIREIDALEPGLGNALAREKEAKLTEEERKAVKTPVSERTAQQNELAARAAQATHVDYLEVARKIRGPNRKKALELATQAQDAQTMVRDIHWYRDIVNYDYWAMRAQAEQEDQTLAARKTIHQGDLVFAEGDLPAAREAYDRGLAMWRKVLDRYPALAEDNTTGADLMDVIRRYGKILSQLDEPLPKPFVLQDFLDRYGDKSEPLGKQ